MFVHYSCSLLQFIKYDRVRGNLKSSGLNDENSSVNINQMTDQIK